MRPVRPSDRDRIVELTRDIWGGHDYLPSVFDDWVADAASAFQALEVDGVVVGLQRLRPYAPGLVWYEGLRVATSHRRQGLARAMLDSAIAEAREQGHGEMRLATGNPEAVRLFESVGFKKLVDVRWWRGPRVEGGESPRIPPAAEAEKLWPMVAKSPGIELFNGVMADFNGARDINAAELARLAETGMLRVGPGGRAVVGLRRPWGNNIAVGFLAGSGGALRELLQALRFEADADGLDDVVVSLPREHPAAGDLRASGYDFANDDDHSYIYALRL
ncbi:MAG TPA: GNAT family N-acetyltransferase [Candidatus Dormibacteraeota bacterium]